MNPQSPMWQAVGVTNCLLSKVSSHWCLPWHGRRPLVLLWQWNSSNCLLVKVSSYCCLTVNTVAEINYGNCTTALFVEKSVKCRLAVVEKTAGPSNEIDQVLMDFFICYHWERSALSVIYYKSKNKDSLILCCSTIKQRCAFLSYHIGKGSEYLLQMKWELCQHAILLIDCLLSVINILIKLEMIRLDYH